MVLYERFMNPVKRRIRHAYLEIKNENMDDEFVDIMNLLKTVNK